MTADSTVEWGEDRRVRWWDRFLGPGPDGSGRPALSAPALGAAVVAVALMLAAELTPWTVAGGAVEVHLGEVGGFQLLAYHLGWMALLALTGVAVVARPETRRLLTAGGLGVAAALLVVTAGVARQASTGGPFTPERQIEADLASGAYFGLAGVVVAVVALLLTGWHPWVRLKRREDVEDELEADAGPADLTVTPLP